MRIVQNFSAIELIFNPADKRLPLKYEQLENKKIQAVYLFGSIPDNKILSPYVYKEITEMGILGIEDFFLNFVDIQQREVIKNLCFSMGYFLFTADENNFVEYNINQLIDINKSYINYIIDTSTEIRTLLLLVFYQTENYQPFSDEVNGSLTIDITPTSEYEDILLKNIVENKLSGKRIKRIITDSSYLPLLSYLDLTTYDGKRIENIPTKLLNERGQKVIYFDNLDIDWNKSYFRQRGLNRFTPEDPATTISLTFIY